ncbi:hypothetical protein GCM10027047_18110 [Rhodococcus aerolatus]
MSTAIVVVLVLLAGFLAGGAWTMRTTSRLFAAVLAVLTALALAGAVAYLV